MEMRRIMNGKGYDTGTAGEIAEYAYGYGSDFDAIREKLFRTPKGQFFAICRGYGSGFFGEYGDFDGNGVSLGEKWFAIDVEQARAWYQHRQAEGSAFDYTVDYEDAFGDAEDA